MALVGTSAALAVLSGCGSTTALTRASFPTYSLSFQYPKEWKRFDCPAGNLSLGGKAMLTYLTTVDAGLPCGVAPTRLGANGVSVSWLALELPGESVKRWRGQHVRLDGHPARIAVISRGPTQPWREFGCEAIGGERAVTAAISRGRDGILVAVSCLRGPNLSASELSVRQMLESVRVTN
jgi:hypothetical protein